MPGMSGQCAPETGAEGPCAVKNFTVPRRFRNRALQPDSRRGQFSNGRGSVASPLKGKPIMQSVLKHSGRAELAILALAALAFALFLFAGPAFAGADTTFDTALTKFTDFLEGSGGKIITVLSLAGGIVALASGRFSMGQIAIPVGVGVGAGTGIPIVTSTVTATI
ncbi:trbC/VIRB2 family protein (plasmid) [Sphingobium sp. RAC03]|nr:trbC/VIRB2 family protein [Sphingobium sp. RAC03]